jgi:folate-binding Fe-S cluster repair protein YgfZ
VIFHVNLDRRLLRLSGRDVVSYLHTKLTVDVRPWPRTGGAYAYAVDINGRIIFDADFSMQPDGQVLAWLRTDRTAAAIAHLDRYVIREDVVLADVSDGWTVLELLDDLQLKYPWSSAAAREWWSRPDVVQGTPGQHSGQDAYAMTQEVDV